MWEPCTNITIGAWVLAQNLKKLGRTLNAVGAARQRRYPHKAHRLRLEGVSQPRQCNGGRRTMSQILLDAARDIDLPGNRMRRTTQRP